jgi:hypothetical protein
VNGEISMLYDLLLSTVQVLGPVLYAIFISPLSDLAFLLTFSNDNYILRFNICFEALNIEIENSLESITKWLRDSSLSVNKTKTELCLFAKGEMRPISVVLKGTVILSKSEINLLGVTFD